MAGYEDVNDAERLAGKQAVKMTRLSCHRFRSNQVRLALSLLAYNLGNQWRRLVLPKRIENWSVTSLRQRLVKTGGRLVKHGQSATHFESRTTVTVPSPWQTIAWPSPFDRATETGLPHRAAGPMRFSSTLLFRIKSR